MRYKILILALLSLFFQGCIVIHEQIVEVPGQSFSTKPRPAYNADYRLVMVVNETRNPSLYCSFMPQSEGIAPENILLPPGAEQIYVSMMFWHSGSRNSFGTAYVPIYCSIGKHGQDFVGSALARIELRRNAYLTEYKGNEYGAVIRINNWMLDTRRDVREHTPWIDQMMTISNLRLRRIETIDWEKILRLEE